MMHEEQASTSAIRVEVHHYHHHAAPQDAAHKPRAFELVHGGRVRLVDFSCGKRVLGLVGEASCDVALRPKESKESDVKLAKDVDVWTLVVVASPKHGQLHSFRSAHSGRFLRICKDGSVDCKGKEGGGLTLFKLNNVRGCAYSFRSVATGLYLAPSKDSISSGAEACAFRVRPAPAAVRHGDGKPHWHKFAFRHRQMAQVGPLVVRLHPLPEVSKPVPLVPPPAKQQECQPAAAAQPSAVAVPSSGKEERLRLKEERLRAKEERIRAKEERLQAKQLSTHEPTVSSVSRMTKEERLHAKQERLRAKEERVRTKQPPERESAVAPASDVPFVGQTVTLRPVQFLETANRSQEKGWHLGISPSGFIVADGAGDSSSQFHVRAAGKGILFEPVHSPQWHLAVRPNLQLTHKGGHGKFAQFIPMRHGADEWSFRSVAHENVFLAVSPQGLLHVAKEEGKATRFKLNVL